MKVIADKSVRNGNKAEVCIEVDSMNEAHSTDARHLAIEHATSVLNMNKPGISGGHWTEWVDAAGNPLKGEAFRNATQKKLRAYFPLQASI